MSPSERQQILDQLTASQSLLLDETTHLSPQQWDFREEPERWSIAENIEHLIHFEFFITQAISNVLARPAEPEKQPHAASKQPDVLSLGSADSRRAKLTAREAVRPTGNASHPILLVDQFRSARARTIAFASETEADLHSHFFPHIAFGDLDCCQWLLVLSQHTLRHVLQIEQIKAHPAYPRPRRVTLDA